MFKLSIRCFSTSPTLKIFGLETMVIHECNPVQDRVILVDGIMPNTICILEFIEVVDVSFVVVHNVNYNMNLIDLNLFLLVIF